MIARNTSNFHPKGDNFPVLVLDTGSAIELDTYQWLYWLGVHDDPNCGDDAIKPFLLPPMCWVELKKTLHAPCAEPSFIHKAISILEKLLDRNYINDFKKESAHLELKKTAGLHNEHKLEWIIETVQKLKLKEWKINFMLVTENPVLRLRASFNEIDCYSMKECHHIYFHEFVSMYPSSVKSVLNSTRSQEGQIEKLFIVDERFLTTIEGEMLLGHVILSSKDGHIAKIFLPIEVQQFIHDFFRDSFLFPPLEKGMPEDRRYFDYDSESIFLLDQIQNLCEWYSRHMIGEKSGAGHEFLEQLLGDPDIFIISEDRSFIHSIRLNLGQKSLTAEALTYSQALEKFCVASADTVANAECVEMPHNTEHILANVSDEPAVSSEESANSSDNSLTDTFINCETDMLTEPYPNHLDSSSEISC